ncbi:MAG TPA: phosphatase PAP2 family protein [Miltoncostaeaceae bacterium]|nr:phosphatase PAP2 family protein [Miltoncostaeaceae bacterium]
MNIRSNVDYQIEQFINGPASHHAALDTLMRDAATWSVPVFIAIVAGWFLFGWIRGLAAERRGALTALLAAAGALLANQIVLLFWQRPRPFEAHPGSVVTLVSRTGDPSFPSDHAAASVAIAVVVFLAHRRLGAVALALAGLVCIARVYVGAHYPTDVLGGALIGAAVAALLWWPFAVPVHRLAQAVDWVIVHLRLPLPDRGTVT